MTLLAREMQREKTRQIILANMAMEGEGGQVEPADAERIARLERAFARERDLAAAAMDALEQQHIARLTHRMEELGMLK